MEREERARERGLAVDLLRIKIYDLWFKKEVVLVESDNSLMVVLSSF